MGVTTVKLHPVPSAIRFVETALETTGESLDVLFIEVEITGALLVTPL
jgi:hypothetical protein